jgi:hypothetical protein
MLDLAYQVQVFKYMMIRPSFAIGGNVANSRNAMPGADPARPLRSATRATCSASPSCTACWSRSRATIGANNGHGGRPSLPSSLTPWPTVATTPSQLEVSLTTKVDRGALNFAVRGRRDALATSVNTSTSTRKRAG